MNKKVAEILSEEEKKKQTESLLKKLPAPKSRTITPIDKMPIQGRLHPHKTTRVVQKLRTHVLQSRTNTVKHHF